MIDLGTLPYRAAIGFFCVMAIRYAIDDTTDSINKGLRYRIAVAEITLASILLTEAVFLTDEHLFTIANWFHRL